MESERFLQQRHDGALFFACARARMVGLVAFRGLPRVSFPCYPFNLYAILLKLREEERTAKTL